MRYLILISDTRVKRELLDRAAALVPTEAWVDAVVPAVLPATLPASAVPPRLAARLRDVSEATHDALRSRDLRGRVQISPCRDAAALLRASHAHFHPDRTLVVGPAGWALRRAAHGLPGTAVLRPRELPPVAPRATPGRVATSAP
ncbi:MAG: hypothetical protein ACTHNU_15710 [Gaiellales bacterium]